jgi:hypothetical protein
MIGTLGLGAGFIAAGSAANLWQFALAQGALIGFLGNSATFVPLVADTAVVHAPPRHRRRNLHERQHAAGARVAAYPPAFHRQRRLAPDTSASASSASSRCCCSRSCCVSQPPASEPAAPRARVGDTPSRRRCPTPARFFAGQLQALLCVAGVACCVAMSMPQVHIVAYCSDLASAPRARPKCSR